LSAFKAAQVTPPAFLGPLRPHASQVVITIAAGEDLRLLVSDDGDGIRDGNSASLGLKSLRQRSERLGGNLELGRSRKGGTRLTRHVPPGSVEAGAAPEV
jgi:glucose-6-phosphate-specific signal transduction histidine kinase